MHCARQRAPERLNFNGLRRQWGQKVVEVEYAHAPGRFVGALDSPVAGDGKQPSWTL